VWGLFGVETRLDDSSVSQLSSIHLPKPEITLVTPGVDKIDESVRFYRDGLDSRCKTARETAMARFYARWNMALALFERVAC